MKLLRKLTKIDKIIKNIHEEELAKQQIEELQIQQRAEKLLETQGSKPTAEQPSVANATAQNADKKQGKDTKATVDNANKITIKTTFNQLWYLLSGMRRKIPKLFILMVANSTIGLFSIALVIPFVLLLQNTKYIASTLDISSFSTYKQFIIQFSRTLYDWLGLSSPSVLVLLFGITFVCMFVLRSLLGVFVEYKVSIYSAEATRHFSGKIFSVLLYISYTYYLGRSAARTMYAMGLSGKSYGIIIGMLNTINDMMLMLIIGVGIAVWTPSIVLIGLLVFLISMGVYKFSHKELKRLGELELELGRQSNQNVYQGIHNFTFSRLFNAEPFYLKLFHSLVDKTIPLNAYKKVIIALPRITIEILLTISFIGYAIYVVIVAPTNVDDIMTTAAVLASAVLKLMPASLRLTGYLGTLAGDQISVDEFYREYTTALAHSIDTSEVENVKPIPFEKEIVVKNIEFTYPEFDESGTTYTYDNSYPILRGLSLRINKGERIGIIGGSGGGKTTLMHTLMAFLTPTKGSIEVDGVDIHKEMRSWQKIIGYVPQETMLMAGSVQENIAFGIPLDAISTDRVIEVLKAAHIWELVDSLPKGIHTDIGDAGKRLSGGQRQRLGIARALYRDPQLIFFDEATSHLDQKTEKEVQVAIDDIGNHKTIIIVAHRLNTLAKCNRIFCVDNGNIVFEGSYKQMMKRYDTK